MDLAFAVEARAGHNPLAVGADIDAPDAALHGGHLADQVGIVADHAGGKSCGAIDFYNTIRTSQNDFVALRMTGEGKDSALEGAGRDRGQVIDKSLSGDFCEFGGHVAADADQMASIFGKDGVTNPVVVGSLEQDLSAGFGVEGTDGIVAATDGDFGAIGRPACSINRVEADRYRQYKLGRFNVPDLEFAGLGRSSTGHCDQLTVGGIAYGFDAFGEADQAVLNLAAGGVDEEDFMEAGDGKLVAGWCKIETCDGDGPRINRQIFGVEAGQG